MGRWSTPRNHNIITTTTPPAEPYQQKQQEHVARGGWLAGGGAVLLLLLLLLLLVVVLSLLFFHDMSGSVVARCYHLNYSCQVIMLVNMYHVRSGVTNLCSFGSSQQ